MGILNTGLELYNQSLDLIENKESIRIFEFGDQIGMEEVPFSGKPAKMYFEEKNYEYVSLDFNGRHGALKRDITSDLSDLGYFDIVTNFGSSEHVEPLHNQYLCFRSLHNLCKCGGIIINQVPPIGKWLGHSPAHYDLSFFEILAKYNEYNLKILHIDESDLISCIFQKNIEKGFMLLEEFPFDKIFWDENNPNKGDYT